MILRTKYDPNHTVWTIHENKAICAHVFGIRINVDKIGGIDSMYTLLPTGTTNMMDLFVKAESECYPTKEKLIESL